MDFLTRMMTIAPKTPFTRGVICIFYILVLLGTFPCPRPCLAAFNLDQVEAAFIFNLTNFVRWPDQATQDRPFVIGVMGNPQVARNLQIIISGEKIKGREAVVKIIDDPSEIEDCDILFIGNSFKGNVDEILQLLRGHPVLTLGESEEFLKKGGMVAFIFTGKRIQIQVSVEAAQQEGISFNSKLLRIAKIYKPERQR
ncbi:MAG: YfiR family protein [Thermodesulfobacteria bacterium]|nr:YfiR family protein [Thermodesulfobacteriota bacterium]